ncbi:MAG: hypothetical protein H0W88_03850 [Parachlamydiaceae bacterium]|nr:hypothetical protein [Parachlamydiaceae bacterium]
MQTILNGFSGLFSWGKPATAAVSELEKSPKKTASAGSSSQTTTKVDDAAALVKTPPSSPTLGAGAGGAARSKSAEIIKGETATSSVAQRSISPITISPGTPPKSGAPGSPVRSDRATRSDSPTQNFRKGILKEMGLLLEEVSFPVEPNSARDNRNAACASLNLRLHTSIQALVSFTETWDSAKKQQQVSALSDNAKNEQFVQAADLFRKIEQEAHACTNESNTEVAKLLRTAKQIEFDGLLIDGFWMGGGHKILGNKTGILARFAQARAEFDKLKEEKPPVELKESKSNDDGEGFSQESTEKIKIGESVKNLEESCHTFHESVRETLGKLVVLKEDITLTHHLATSQPQIITPKHIMNWHHELSDIRKKFSALKVLHKELNDLKGYWGTKAIESNLAAITNRLLELKNLFKILPKVEVDQNQSSDDGFVSMQFSLTRVIRDVVLKQKESIETDKVWLSNAPQATRTKKIDTHAVQLDALQDFILVNSKNFHTYRERVATKQAELLVLTESLAGNGEALCTRLGEARKLVEKLDRMWKLEDIQLLSPGIELVFQSDASAPASPSEVAVVAPASA